jgi:hypothetical protein
MLEQMLNDPTRHVFCAAPGDYRAAGRIDIFTSGTQQQRRILRINIADGKRNAAERSQKATFEVIYLVASNWVIQGLQFRPKQVNNTWFVTILGGDHNIIDGNVIDGIEQLNVTPNMGVMVKGYQGDPATYNSIQGNLIRNGNMPKRDVDYIGVAISQGQSPTEANDFNKVLDNEVVDWGDAVAVTGTKEDCTELAVQHGTIIDGNDLYITAAKRIDCDTGAQNPNGECACAENGVDVKSDPGAAPELWTRVTNNRAWGFRPTSDTILCGGSGANGQAITAGSICPGHTLVAGNVVSDSTSGITIGGRNWIVASNILTEIRESTDLGPYVTNALQPAYFSTDIEIEFNTVVGADASYDDQSSYTDTRCNAVLEDRALPGPAGTRGAFHTTEYNYLYQAPQPNFEGGTNQSFATPEDSGNIAYCYWRKRWSGPEKICIPYGATTYASRHWAAAPHCDFTIGAPFGLSLSYAPEPDALALAATSAAALAAVARRRRRASAAR